MTQEEKDLLLKDLSARLFYEVIIHLVEPNEDEELYCLNIPQEGLYTRSLYNNVTTLSPLEDIKPYLRPMTSMTEEEKKEISILLNYEFYIDDDYALVAEDNRHRIRLDLMQIYIDYLNAHHFDYCGLIEKGLALEAPTGMYR